MFIYIQSAIYFIHSCKLNIKIVLLKIKARITILRRKVGKNLLTCPGMSLSRLIRWNRRPLNIATASLNRKVLGRSNLFRSTNCRWLIKKINCDKSMNMKFDRTRKVSNLDCRTHKKRIADARMEFSINQSHHNEVRNYDG